MPEVSFKIESNASQWELFLRRKNNKKLILKILSPNNMVKINLSVGYYDYSFTIRGDVGSTGSLTIERPRFEPIIVPIEISDDDDGLSNMSARFLVLNPEVLV